MLSFMNQKIQLAIKTNILKFGIWAFFTGVQRPQQFPLAFYFWRPASFGHFSGVQAFLGTPINPSPPHDVRRRRSVQPADFCINPSPTPFTDIQTLAAGRRVRRNFILAGHQVIWAVNLQSGDFVCLSTVELGSRGTTN